MIVLKQKKTMKMWQFIVTEILLLVMFITMFIPMFSLTGNSLIKGTKKVFQNMELGALGIDEKAIDEYLQQAAEEFDAEIKDYEKEFGVHISNISPCKIMTKSFVDFLYGDSVKENERDEIQERIDDDETMQAMQKGYKTLKIVFWIVYVLILAVLILGIIGFCVKFVKYITLSINIVCGVFTVGIFVFLRFGVMGTIAKEAGDVVNEMLGFMAAALDVEALVKTMLNGIYVVPFSILTIGIPMILLICSILFMFIGKPKTVQMQNGLEDPFGIDYQEPEFGDVPFGEASYGEMQNDISDQVTVPMTDAFEMSPFDNSFAQVTEPLMEDEEVSVISPEFFEEQVTVPMTEDFAESPFESSFTSAENTGKDAAQQSAMGRVWVKQGVAKGQGFMLPQNRKVVVGKNPQSANLVINHPHISNIHCSIRYNAENNSYIVKDHSSNGTFVNGVRLQKNVAMEYPAGTVLCLADGSEEISLG